MSEFNQYVCAVCGHIHDEAVDGKLSDLPKYANCTECGCGVEEYQLIE